MSDSKPTPNLVLFFACEDAAVNIDETVGDLQYGWWELKKPLYHVYNPVGSKQTIPELCLYYQLSGGVGEYKLTAEFRRLNLAEPKKTLLLMRSDFVSVFCNNTFAVVEDAIVMREFEYPTPGHYQFTIRCDGIVLDGGTWYLRVSQEDELRATK